MAKVIKEITEFRDWLKKTYGIQDYEAYRDSQTEEMCIQYASLKEQEVHNRAVQECKEKLIEIAQYPHLGIPWVALKKAKEELEKLKK